MQNNLFDLAGKTILITGASSGIGREIAIQVAQHGGRVVITGRNSDRLQETAQAMGSDTTIIAAELTDTEQAITLVKQLPQLDGVVCCAGAAEYTPVKFVNTDKIRTLFAINFDSQVVLTQQLLKQKKLNKKASLVYVSSISSQIGVAGTTVYAASKAALNSFVKVLATEVAGQQMRANSICPGLIRTPMLDRATDVVSQETIDANEKKYPLGLGTPTDVAGPTIFLLSDAARWVTGTNMILDGGLTVE